MWQLSLGKQCSGSAGLPQVLCGSFSLHIRHFLIGKMDGRFFFPSTGLNDSLASLLWESCCVSFASHVLVIYSEQFEAISASLSPKGSKGGLVRGFLQNGLNSGLVGIIYSNLPSKLRGPSKSNNHRLLRNDALYQ